MYKSENRDKNLLVKYPLAKLIYDYFRKKD